MTKHDHIDTLVRLALADDVGTGDITAEATIPEDARAKATIRAKEELVVAGCDVAHRTFQVMDEATTWTAHRADGDRCAAGDVLAELSGNARMLLAAERTALNFLQHLSGIATLTRHFVDAAAGTKAAILDTRKTLPGWRELEKMAVRAGGGTNHRMGLYDQYLIKNNHIAVAGSVKKAVEMAKAARKGDEPIEVEVRNEEELAQALGAGAEIIMLDNMALPQIEQAVKRTAGRAQLEVSGNVTLDRVALLAATGVDRLSVGALTHSAPAADIHMLVEIA